MLTQTQSPTDFWLDTYPIAQVFDTPELISSLARYSEKRQKLQLKDTSLLVGDSLTPTLFLRIQAAASYYSTNRTLMDYPPAVDADISTFTLASYERRQLTLDSS